MIQITPHLSVFNGHINVGIIRDGNRALLLDFGDESVITALNKSNINEVDTILFTHHHRDQACGAYKVPDAKIIVPELEKRWFESAKEYWSEPAYRWHYYTFRPSRLMLSDSLHVDGVVSDGDVLDWGPAHIEVLSTPGHTDGSVSYIIDVDGRRIAFTGDIMYDSGKIWNLYDLQKGIGIMDYHGFMGARYELIDSLNRLMSENPDTMIPSHGPIIHDVKSTITSTIRNIHKCYELYAGISAARFYFPDVFTDCADSKKWMKFDGTTPPPAFLKHTDTSWIIISDSGAAFVMDCGIDDVVNDLKRWMDTGEIKSVDGIWITHYHDDHVNSVPLFQQEFDCELIADPLVADIIENPRDWRLSCISPDAVRVDRRTTDGEQWQWHEFIMTAYHFPGQSLYHGGLMVEGHGARMFFAGDSFTPSGIDDYCPFNRNFLSTGSGYNYCIELLMKLSPDYIFNAHIDQAFSFKSKQYKAMKDNLQEREQAFGNLFPWSHPDYGTDEHWAFCHPYEQTAAPGSIVRFNAVITNNSEETIQSSCRVVPPGMWNQTQPVGSNFTAIEPKHSTKMELAITVPPGAIPGRYVIPVDIVHGNYELPQFIEAIIVIE